MTKTDNLKGEGYFATSLKTLIPDKFFNRD